MYRETGNSILIRKRTCNGLHKKRRFRICIYINSYEEVENFIQIRNELLQQGLNLEDYWEAIPVKLSLIDYNSI